MNFISPAFKKAVDEVKAIRGVKFEILEHDCVYFTLPLFHGRIHNFMVSNVLEEEVNNYVEIQLGERKTFDRWANSVNFYTHRTKESGCYYPLFRPQYNWAVKVSRSGLFTFNNYFHRIELPHFEVAKLKLRAS